MTQRELSYSARSLQRFYRRCKGITLWQISRMTSDKHLETVAVSSSRERGELLMLKMGWPDGTYKPRNECGDYILNKTTSFMGYLKFS